MRIHNMVKTEGEAGAKSPTEPTEPTEIINYISTDHLDEPSVQIMTTNREVVTLLGKIGTEGHFETDCTGCGVHFFEIGGYFTTTCEGCRKPFCGNCMKIWQGDEVGRESKHKQGCSDCVKKMEDDYIAKKNQELNEKTRMYTDRIYINVPEDECDDAEDLGAQWDQKAQLWYIPSREHEAFELYGPKKLERAVLEALISGKI